MKSALENMAGIPLQDGSDFPLCQNPQILKSVVHDLNNILAAMNGYAEFLVEDLADFEQQKTFADRILQSGHKALALVEDLRAFAQGVDRENDSVCGKKIAFAERLCPTGVNILLVDDQAEMQMVTQTMLERLGYDVEMASTGLEAIDMIREKPGHYGLVLTDYRMPKMTGLELFREVQCDFPDLPFVFLSGDSHEKLENLVEENPLIWGALKKPVSQKALGEMLENAFIRET